MKLDYTRPIRVKGTHEKVEILRTDLPGNWPILAVITRQDGSQYGDHSGARLLRHGKTSPPPSAAARCG